MVVVGGVRLHSRIETSRILNSYRETRLLVYEIQTFEDKPGVELRLLESKDIHGSYQSIRSIGTSVHVVTSTTLDFFFFLFEPMVRYRPTFEGLDDAAYTNRVREVATQEMIPTFVKLLSQELSECNELPRMVRLNRWATEATPKAASGLEHYLYNMGFAQSLMSIYSFDLQDVQSGQGKALQCLRSTATFFPAAPWSTKVYAANDTLVVATEGYDYQAPQKRFVRSTFLVAYDLNEAVSTPKALGNVQGNVMGQYSFRVEDSVLQVATTIQEQWTWWRREPAWLLRGRRQLQERQDVVFTVPKTENWVITMDLQGKKGRMQEMDRLKLGKEGEVFTTVRFYKDKAYAVTFLRMDPFYVLDTSDPYNLAIAGELDNITGWSSYLEPMNDDKSACWPLVKRRMNEEESWACPSLCLMPVRWTMSEFPPGFSLKRVPTFGPIPKGCEIRMRFGSIQKRDGSFFLCACRITPPIVISADFEYSLSRLTRLSKMYRVWWTFQT